MKIGIRLYILLGILLFSIINVKTAYAADNSHKNSKIVKKRKHPSAKVSKKFDILVKDNNVDIDFTNPKMKKKFAQPFLHQIDLSTMSPSLKVAIPPDQMTLSERCQKAEAEYDKLNFSKLKTFELMQLTPKISNNIKMCGKSYKLWYYLGLAYYHNRAYDLATDSLKTAIGLKWGVNSYGIYGNDIPTTTTVRDVVQNKTTPSNTTPTPLPDVNCQIFNSRVGYTGQIDSMTKIIASNPKYGKPLFCRGFSYLMLGEYDNAKTDIATARKVDPAYAAKDIDGMFSDAIVSHYNDRLINGDADLANQASSYGSSELQTLKDFLTDRNTALTNNTSDIPNNSDVQDVQNNPQVQNVQTLQQNSGPDINNRMTEAQEQALEQNIGDKAQVIKDNP